MRTDNRRQAPDLAVFDVDGTLVDTNYHHALAWYRAFRAHGVSVPVWRLHRAIGMGGDQLVAAVAGEQVEDKLGDDVRARWAEEVEPLFGEIQACEGAVELLYAARDWGLRVVLASSAKQEHLDRYLELLDGGSMARAYTTSADVDTTKPHPGLLEAAVDKAGGGIPIVIGDSVWDFEACQRAGYVGYGVRTGGFCAEELRDAGATEVYDSLPELHEALRRSLNR
jgi:HAD superfamily hydrolase (TIGR01549 family)